MEEVHQHISGNGDSGRALVVVFLRGGADGLNLVPPIDDDGYYRSRPRIAVDRKVAVPLDGFFALNPLLRELEPFYREGQLAVIHGVGSEDGTRSHFEAQDLMEHGGLAAGGWLGRFLRYRPDVPIGPLSAVAVGKTIPESLRGAPAATVMESMDDFALGSDSIRLVRELRTLYALENGPLAASARDTFEALNRIEKVNAGTYRPAHGADYASDPFSQGLLQVARLIKARVGLEAVSIDLGGWDSHFSQGTIMDPLMVRLSRGLAAFGRDLGTAIERTTVVVMTEFGRRLRENSAFGTDHGRGSVMFALGGGVKGGRVLGRWPGLNDDVLEGPGDLPVTTNYRDVLAPILRRHGAGPELEQVFPDFKLAPLDLYG